MIDKSKKSALLLKDDTYFEKKVFGNLSNISDSIFKKSKKFSFSDIQLAHMLESTEQRIEE